MLFVCKLGGPPSPTPEIGASFILLDTPRGRFAQAFESLELARTIVQFDGILPDVFLLPEERLTPALRAVLESVPVFVYRTVIDYMGALRNDPRIPWEDRVVHYRAGAGDVPGTAT